MAWAAPIAGAVVGGLMSKSGSGSTSTQTAEPWSGVQPALTQLYSSALNNFNGGGPQYYPGSTVAGQSNATQQSQQGVYDIASNPSQNLGAAQQQNYDTLNGSYFGQNPATQGLYDFAGADFMNSGNGGLAGLQATANGDFLNANPNVDAMFNQASQGVGRQFSQNVLPGVASMFSAGGRYGSGQMANGVDQASQQYGNTINGLATSIYGGNYANERALMSGAQNTLTQAGLAGRGLQQNALGMLGDQFGRERVLQQGAVGQAPGLAQADYYDMGQMANLGATQDTYSQSLINADMARYNFGQNAPNQQLNFLSSILNGAPMGNTTTQFAPGNPIMGALGGYQLGGALAKGFGGMGGASTVAGPGDPGWGMDLGGGDYSSFY